MAYSPKARASISRMGDPKNNTMSVVKAMLMICILSPRLQIDCLGLLVQSQPYVPQVSLQNAGPGAMQRPQLRRQQLERFHLGLRPESFDLHGPPGLHDFLIGGGLRQT